jgi:glycosyltransferase involved in cell wall biosynthesis
LLVEPRDSQSLADAITTLLKDEALRTRMGAAGLVRVREQFTVDRMVAGTLAVYEQVLAATGEGVRRD